MIDSHLDRGSNVDVGDLAQALAPASFWPGCPQARDLAEELPIPYRRIPLSDVRTRDYEALLILWPPGHTTPIHDHAGLWGIELVLDGVLEVESFALSLQSAPRLVARDKSILGIGDHTSFSDADYAHRCHNLSPNQPTLSLHIYGGELDTYRSYHQQRSGDWVDAVHQARREPALV